MCHSFSKTRNSKINILKKTPRSAVCAFCGSFLTNNGMDHCSRICDKIAKNKANGGKLDNNINSNFFIIISGPTAVGKTDFVEKLVKHINFKAEIINADLGQFYKYLNIGTAKPNLEEQAVKHHLFDILDKPTNFTVFDYRKALINCMNELWKKSVIPIIVGGSGFYIKSIFFPPKEYLAKDHQVLDENGFEQGRAPQQKNMELSSLTTEELYEKLLKIDVQRAKEINPNDRYRLERALEFWLTTGQKPSKYKPEFQVPGKCILLFLTRNKEELNKRILDRTSHMLNQGWIEEVENLPENWQNFLLKKKIIGYPEVIDYIRENKTREKPNLADREALIKKIAQKTRTYAKRQLTFWKSFCKLLINADVEKCGGARPFIKEIIEINLSLINLDLCIRQLSEKLDGLIPCK